MRRTADVAIALLIPLLIVLHLLVAPYTKVEESFNLQATFDILTYGISLKNASASLVANYDHIFFPGSVPRTFVGPLVLAGTSRPFIWLVDGVDRQIFVRAILGLYNAFSLLAFRYGIDKAFGPDIANWYTLFQASQFHIMYYASRTLPNFFAFGTTILALRSLTPPITGLRYAAEDRLREYQKGLVLLTAVGVVFRSELAVLLGTNILWLLLRKRLRLEDTILPGLLGLILGLCVTVPVDSFFWQHVPLWPELTGFIYNVMDGKSADWGVSPIYYYFSSALPRLLMNPLAWQVCIPLALSVQALRYQALDMLIPNLAFVAIYSLQRHKEWRFIVYVIPSITTVAAMGASWIWTRRNKSMAYRVLALGLVASTLGSFAASFGMLAVSSFNYPGAEALNYLHAYADGSQNVINVHMDTLSCMTGITRFLQISTSNTSSLSGANTLWLYDKSEDDAKLLHPAFWEQFDYVLAERPEKLIGSWEIIYIVEGFKGVELVRPEETLRDSSTPLLVLPSASHISTLGRSFKAVAGWMRIRVTRGWWLQARMEPSVRVLKHIRSSD